MPQRQTQTRGTLKLTNGLAYIYIIMPLLSVEIIFIRRFNAYLWSVRAVSQCEVARARTCIMNDIRQCHNSTQQWQSRWQTASNNTDRVFSYHSDGHHQLQRPRRSRFVSHNICAPLDSLCLYTLEDLHTLLATAVFPRKPLDCLMWLHVSDVMHYTYVNFVTLFE